MISDQPPTGIKLPGQPVEEAAADVGKNAGNSIVRGFARLTGATFDEWIKKREARAEAAKLAIETSSKIEAEQSVIAARREYEIAEADHQDLLQRRLVRLKVELAHEQKNLETVEHRAIELRQASPEARGRDLDEAWLFGFADLAQKISDEQLQSIWARALTSAATEGEAVLSAAGLQTLSLFDKKIASDFRNFVAVLASVGFFLDPGNKDDIQNIDIGNLEDIGLVSRGMADKALTAKNFQLLPGDSRTLRMPYLYSRLSLTRRGYEIAQAVLGAEEVELDTELQIRYIQKAIAQFVKDHKGTILTMGAEASNSKDLLIADLINGQKTKADISDLRDLSSERLRQILDWAVDSYATLLVNVSQ
jgi:hypothetical protein